MSWIAMVALTFIVYDADGNEVAKEVTNIEIPNQTSEALCNASAVNMRRLKIRNFVAQNSMSPGFSVKSGQVCLVDIDGDVDG